MWGFILVPVCIAQDATVGQWQLKMTTPVADATTPHNEIIGYSFEIK